MNNSRIPLAITLLMLINSSLMAKEDLRTEMVETAQRAVETVRNIEGVSLNYSVESLKEIDRIVISLREKQGNDPKPFENVLFMLGAYVGEVYIRNFEGSQWIEAPKEFFEVGAARESDIWLKGIDGSFYNPIGKVYKLMLNGEEDSVYHLYNYIVSKNENN